jgi:hypothetical protein
MTDVAAWIEEELGLDVNETQRAILHAMFPPPPPPAPPVPPSNWTKAKRWFNRVVLRRKPGISLSTFDRVLRETYAPGLAATINQQSPLMKMLQQSIAKRHGEIEGRHAVWTIKDEVVE